MNNHKFAFIICTNNAILIDECIQYINLLRIPENFEIDVITISDAPSIASGYNTAMRSTDAKYKIYLHQDVFIINQNFLYDILSIFNIDSKIGMIGMVGYKKISQTGCMWHEERFGTTKLFGATKDLKSRYTIDNYLDYEYSLTDDNYTDVSLIDGLLMATQCDLEWDETLLKDWDFYDAFQSMAFIQSGYKVVVPNQSFPWFIHDDGHFLSMWNYNKYRKLFLQKYSRFIGLLPDEIRRLSMK